MTAAPTCSSGTALGSITTPAPPPTHGGAPRDLLPRRKVVDDVHLQCNAIQLERRSDR